MNHREQVQHNAKLILPHVRGKSVKERRQFYATLMMGPRGIGVAIIDRLWVDGQKVFDIETDKKWTPAMDRRVRHTHI